MEANSLIRGLQIFDDWSRVICYPFASQDTAPPPSLIKMALSWGFLFFLIYSIFNFAEAANVSNYYWVKVLPIVAFHSLVKLLALAMILLSPVKTSLGLKHHEKRIRRYGGFTSERKRVSETEKEFVDAHSEVDSVERGREAIFV
eukprot:1332038-Amorphochlora_amoeboformis.AAC.1